MVVFGKDEAICDAWMMGLRDDEGGNDGLYGLI